MPSDANGVYSLPNGYEAVTGETIQASQHNPPLEDLASAMSQRLMRSGVAPMTGALKVTDGSVGSPAIKFNSDGTTGLYKTANGFGVSVGGTQVAEFLAGGVKGARYIGELIPYTGLSALALTVFPYGQTLSRTTYADLWEFAQDEIANGNTFYNNGDGSTTFGVGDCRGRVIAGKDDMGGTSAGRLPSSGAVTGTTLGYAGGEAIHTLTAAKLPSITSNNPSQAISVTSTQTGVPSGALLTATLDANAGNAYGAYNSTPLTLGQITSTGTASITVTSSNTLGQGHNNIQPTIVGTFLLFAGA